ncbi:uncharacterized protein PV09_04647 [Verruconis gallopava]|uniref:Rhodopsin domain-containing protein n=1 Tax=Verruconis gallopava TaxID=253628 RepID=A0A0D2ABY5_9PEZI|nr:uncharacterized protein PV09_04647 [Verruconis gallopava]KIW04363.1 hypothetical protein PV09_04647 [Verruconis gallopava]
MFRSDALTIISHWPPGNFVDPKTRGDALYVVTGVFLSISTISLSARMYSRIWIRRYFGPDDGLILFAWIASLGVAACSILGHRNYGWDRHAWDIRPNLLPMSLKVLYFARICWGLATSAARLSICFLYMRLLSRIGVGPPLFRRILHIFTAVQVALVFVYIFTGIFACWPIKAYWSLVNMPGQHCDDDPSVMKACAIINTVSEFILASMPIIAVYKLHVDPKQRWTVIMLLSLGFLVGFAGCFRTYFLWKSVSSPTLDLSWMADPHWMASQVEIDLSITCACAAPLRPLFSYLFRKAKGLPSQLPTIRGKRPSFSTYASRRTEMDYDFQPGWIAPRPQYFDLEGLPCDGYGYTVIITGPVKRRSRLHRRKSVRETEVQQPVLQKPAAVARASSTQPDSIRLDISTTKEVDVRHSWNWPRISQDKFKPFESRSSASGDIEMAGKKDKSWFQD